MKTNDALIVFWQRYSHAYSCIALHVTNLSVIMMRLYFSAVPEESEKDSFLVDIQWR